MVGEEHKKGDRNMVMHVQTPSCSSVTLDHVWSRLKLVQGPASGKAAIGRVCASRAKPEGLEGRARRHT